MVVLVELVAGAEELNVLRDQRAAIFEPRDDVVEVQVVFGAEAVSHIGFRI
jgi:hypothetical protein